MTSNTSKPAVAVIGTGIMGSRMAQNLLNNGYPVTVHNRTQAKTDDLVGNGATWAASPADAARDADIVITMLAHPQAVEDAATNPNNGLLSALQDGKLWVDCSTINPDFARRMHRAAIDAGVRYMDAPVAGSKNQAQDAQLIFVVGGDEADVAEAEPLFQAMGRAVNHVGEAGMGNALKLVINHLLATSMAAFAEGLVLGESMGLSQETLLNTLLGAVVTPAYLQGKRAKLEGGDYDAEFPLRWMQKDTAMVADTAFLTGAAMPVANATKELFQLAVTHGYGELDLSAIYAFLKGERV